LDGTSTGKPLFFLYLVVKIMLSYGKKHGFPFSHPLTTGFADSPGFWWIFRWETPPNHRRNFEPGRKKTSAQVHHIGAKVDGTIHPLCWVVPKGRIALVFTFHKGTILTMGV